MATPDSPVTLGFRIGIGERLRETSLKRNNNNLCSRNEQSNCDQVKSVSATNPSFKSHLKVPGDENLIDF